MCVCKFVSNINAWSKGPVVGASSLLPRESQGLISGHQAWQQAPLSAKPPRWVLKEKSVKREHVKQQTLGIMGNDTYNLTNDPKDLSFPRFFLSPIKTQGVEPER